MKQTISILMVAVIFYSCGNGDQTQATEQAKNVQKVVKKNSPGSISTTGDGYTMNAKLNGKDWTAESMMPPDIAGRIVGYYNGEYIGLPYSKSNLVVGSQASFGEDNAVDLLTSEKNVMWGNQKGEMKIIKVDEKWAEGRFFLSATDSRSGKTIEVTDGFFRIPVPGNQ